MDIIKKKLKVANACILFGYVYTLLCIMSVSSLFVAQVAGGADYDTGSNASGYTSSGNIKARALQAYGEKVSLWLCDRLFTSIRLISMTVESNWFHFSNLF